MYQNEDLKKKKLQLLSTELRYHLSGRGGIGRRASFRYSYLMVWEFKSPRPHEYIQIFILIEFVPVLLCKGIN